MKIGIFSDTYYPQINGVATSVLLLKEYLEKKGHEVYVFTTTDPKAPVHEERVARYPSIPFSNTGRRIAAVLYPAIERAFKRNDFDIIHTHTEFSIGILGRRLARSLEIPHVHTMH
ncbi:MAG TPA: glycosyltransferase, partial [Bacillota bacterium]|nr:glycosyltransferase [Bacillota bacterium]